MAINNLKINRLNFLFIMKNIIEIEQGLDTQKIIVDVSNLSVGDKYKKRIKKFIEVANSNFKFRNPNEILSTLKIKESKRSSYNIEENKIRVKEAEDIYHELFHTLTTIILKKASIVGFNQWNNYIDMAISLNEGYTDLLSKQYFDAKIYYNKEANIANKVELIIGKARMQQMYSSNDLMGIINFLAQYTSKMEAVSFITLMDKLNGCKSESKKSIRIMNICSNYLVNLYLSFLSESYRKGMITNFDVNQKLSIFKEQFAKYAFDSKIVKRQYLRSNDYYDITSKLSNESFQKQLSKKS